MGHIEDVCLTARQVWLKLCAQTNSHKVELNVTIWKGETNHYDYYGNNYNYYYKGQMKATF